MAGNTQKPKPSPKDGTEKLKGKLKRKVGNLTKVADVLTGKDIPEGIIGEKIKKQRALERNFKGGEKARGKKYKKFDEWLARQQKINNTRDGNVPNVRIKRATVRDEKDNLF